jgi:hypothetical protein
MYVLIIREEKRTEITPLAVSSFAQIQIKIQILGYRTS